MQSEKKVNKAPPPSQVSFDHESHLSISDVFIHWSRRVARIYIKKSKTDPFRQGVFIRIGVLSHHLCPVRALIRYLARRGPRSGPLFFFSNGAFLTRAHIHDLLGRSLPLCPNVNTHSFRRGGASALAAVGTPAHTIQILGRWRSNAYTLYIQFSDAFIVDTNHNMGPDPSGNP